MACQENLDFIAAELSLPLKIPIAAVRTGPPPVSVQRVNDGAVRCDYLFAQPDCTRNAKDLQCTSFMTKSRW